MAARLKSSNIEELSEEIGKLYGENKYEVALKLAARVAALAEQAYGTGDSRYAAALSDVATLHAALDDYDAAVPLMREALRIVGAQKGEADSEFAKVLGNLAELYSKMEDYPHAEEANLRAVAIKKQTFGDQDLDYAQTLNNLGALYQRMGRFQDAETRFLEVLRIRRAQLPENDPAIVSSLNNLAASQHSLGKYGFSEENYLLALNSLRISGNTDSEAAFDLRSNLAALYGTIGRFKESLHLHSEVLEFRRKAVGEWDRDYASSINSVAGQFHLMGQYAEAESRYKRSLEIRRKVLGDIHSETAASWNNLASLHHDMGHYKKALPLYRKALAIRKKVHGEHHPDYLQNLNNLAGLFESMEDYAAAKSLYLQALHLRRESLGTEHVDYAQSLNNLAALYYLMDRFDEIEPLLLESLRIWRVALESIHPDVVLNVNNLAAYYYAIGEHSKAEYFYREALALNTNAGRTLHPDYAANLNNLAVLLAATRRDLEALELKRQAAAVDDRMMGQIFSISSEAERMAFLLSIRASTESFLSLVVERLSENHDAVISAFDLVQRRKGVGAQALGAQRDAVLGGRYPHLRDQLERLSASRAELARILLAGPAAGSVDAYLDDVQELEDERNRLEDDLVRCIPEMDVEKELRSADSRSIAAALPDSSVLIEVVKFDSFDFAAIPAHGDVLWRPARYAAFVLPAGKPDRIRLVDLGEAAMIDEALNRFRGAIAPEGAESAPQTTPDPGITLRDLVFDPVAAAFDYPTYLLIAADGDLTKLPYEVLPGANGARLIEKFQISYLGVGRDILRFGSGMQGRQPGLPIVIAAPNFNLASTTAPAPRSRAVKRSTTLDPRRLYFGKLDGTKLEGKNIAKLLGVDPLMGDEALEGSIRRSLSPSVLHLATHGLFLPSGNEVAGNSPPSLGPFGHSDKANFDRLENPLLRSGIVLAGYNTWARGRALPPDAEDGLLTAEDVSGMNMLDTDLVVLSACETGLGEIQTGEGVFGLRRAFAIAGTQGLVMSLWKVPDDATRLLMEEFYRQVLAQGPKASPAVALRQAQLVLKSQPDLADPLYWGAFIYEGNPHSYLSTESFPG